jgi:putative ABC transport system permease protein
MWDVKPVPITGVVRDFHTRSLHEQIKPTAIGTWTGACHTFSVALVPQKNNHGSWQAAIKKMEKSWKELYPDADFEYQFLDESIAKFYTGEKNISRLLNWATGLAIFISCLGLLGLVIFVTNRRTKEIGIRKINGARVIEIMVMLNKDFVKWVAIAFLIATPIAYYAMNKWLENFAYKTELSWWIFALAGMLALGIALLTVSWQSWRVATRNPMESLRYE